MLSLSAQYQLCLQQHKLEPDAAQLPVIEHLDRLVTELSSPARFWRKAKSPRGVYVYGAVGRGKSMLMDLFFETAIVPQKRRVHFNAFMLEVHARLHAARLAYPDTLPRVALELAREARLLCFDEFQVNDIADAMILGRLFTILIDRGVTIVATSNVPPDDLYRNGLQRDLFLPFIALLKQRLDIVEIESGIDHRLLRLAGQKIYFTPDDEVAARALDQLFAALSDGEAAKSASVENAGRPISVPLAAGRIARLHFADLCRTALGAGDYLALAKRYAVLIVEHVPYFEAAARNEGLRFITLIDQLYETRTKVILSAAGVPDQLYPQNGPLAFEFRRTVSRLAEMQSADYLSDPDKN